MYSKLLILRPLYEMGALFTYSAIKTENSFFL